VVWAANSATGARSSSAWIAPARRAAQSGAPVSRATAASFKQSSQAQMERCRLRLKAAFATVLTWVGRLRRLCPIETIRHGTSSSFDMQAMQKPESRGALVQQGERMGYEVREYLLEKSGGGDVPMGGQRRFP